MLEKLNKKSIKYKLKEGTLENLRATLGLEGEGTKESPIIIDNLGDVAITLSMRTKSKYIILRNLTISKLSIIDSQNITIENCFIGDLEISVCQNLIFTNNTILSIRQVLCKNCLFENNNIIQKEYARLIHNVHEKRTFVYVWICLFVGILYAAFAITSLVFLYVTLDTIVFLIAGILLSSVMVYLLYLRNVVKKSPQNKYINFKLQERDTLVSSLQ